MSDIEKAVIELIARWQSRAESLIVERDSLMDKGTLDSEDEAEVMSAKAAVYYTCARMLAEQTKVPNAPEREAETSVVR